MTHAERDHKPLHKRPMYERSLAQITPVQQGEQWTCEWPRSHCPGRFTMRTMVDPKGFQFPYSRKVNDGQPSYRTSVQEGSRWASQKVHDERNSMVGIPGGDPNFRPQEGGRWMMPRGERWMRSPAAEMLRIKLSHYRCRKDTAVQLVEWVVISFGVRRDCIFLKDEEPKYVQNPALGLCCQYLASLSPS